MSDALAQQNRTILYQICDWGVSFPAGWAPSLGNSWRIGNDISSSWSSIFRLANQAVPQTNFAGAGQWADMDMLEVGNGVYTTPEEQTHFSLWAILKSPLVIGAALKDDVTAISEESLGILMQEDVIGFNQDELGMMANLSRRYTEEEYDVWSGPLSGGRTVVALVNWADEARELTVSLPDVGIQYAATVKDIWNNVTVQSVKTSYTSQVQGHGTLLLELQDTDPSGQYNASVFGTSTG
jgi:alpha-galactosidase